MSKQLYIIIVFQANLIFYDDNDNQNHHDHRHLLIIIL